MKTGVHYGLDYTVYRTLPTHCHSEICAMVVDATVPLDLSAPIVDSSTASRFTESGADEEESECVPLKCQQGWRHMSTLTRVMPVRLHANVLNNP